MICCILFLANVVAMFYCAIQGWANGDTSKIFRATDKNGVVCGLSGGVAQDYPYAYFYNPISSVSNRYCVQSCPTSGVSPSCYGVNCSALSWTTIYTNGSAPSGTDTSLGYLLYDSESVMSRICIPSTAVLTNVFSTIVDTLSTAASSGTFSSFINDLKQVYNLFYLLRTGPGCCVPLDLLL